MNPEERNDLIKYRISRAKNSIHEVEICFFDENSGRFINEKRENLCRLGMF